MIYSACLRHDGDLKNALLLGLQVLLPARVHRSLASFLKEETLPVPSKSMLSRWKLLLDAAFMLFHRAAKGGRAPQDKYVRYLIEQIE